MGFSGCYLGLLWMLIVCMFMYGFIIILNNIFIFEVFFLSLFFSMNLLLGKLILEIL